MSSLKINQELEELVAHIAHELLTPITSLIMSNDFLLDHFEEIERTGSSSFSNEDLLNFTKRISRNSIDIKDQAVNILNYFSEEREDLPPEPLNVCNVIMETLEEFEFRFHEQGINLNISMPDRIQARIVRANLITILRNIISNAIKFTHANGQRRKKEITIKASSSEKLIEISVIDTGIGMPSNFLTSESLYKFGERSINAKSSEVKGYGIGLTTVKQMLARIQGEIAFSSKENEGTSVLISIPLIEIEEEEEIG